MQGSFTAAGYQLSYGKGGQPVFRPASTSDWSPMGGGPLGNQNGLNSSSVSALAVSGSTLYVSGGFTAAGGVPANYVAQWDGTTWSSLGTGPANGTSGTVVALAVSGSTLYAGGYFDTAGGVPAVGIAKWDGTSWSALGSGLTSNGYNSYAISLAVSGTTLYAGGNFDSAGGVPAVGIAKWDGTSWSSLGTGLQNSGYNGYAKALAVSGTTLYASGYFNSAGGVVANGIAKWDGTSWSALGTGLSNSGSLGYASTLAVSGSALYAGGYFTAAGGVATGGIAQWDGTSWSALGTGLRNNGNVGYATTLAVSGGTLYAGGYFNSAGGVAASGIAKWDGTSWSTLGGGLYNGNYNGSAQALAVSGTTLYAGGNFNNIAGGLLTNYVAQWDGTTWSPLGTGAADGTNNAVLALAVSGNILYVGGSFTSAGGVPANGVAKWDGTTWSALSNGLTSSGYASSVLALAVIGNSLYAGGNFDTASGVAVSGIAQWNGISWISPGSGLRNNGSLAQALAMVVSGTTLYVGGNFNSAGGVPADGIAKWDGTSWSALGTGLRNGGNLAPAQYLAVSGSTLYAAGYFDTAGGVPATGVAKWNGTTWAALATDLGNSASVLAPSSSGLYVGGAFLESQ